MIQQQADKALAVATTRKIPVIVQQISAVATTAEAEAFPVCSFYSPSR